MERMGYVMTYVGCPVLCGRNLQTKMDLTTTEAENTEMRQAIRESKTFMALKKEAYFIFYIHLIKQEVF